MLKKQNLIRATIWFIVVVILTDTLAYLRRGEFVFYDPDVINKPVLIFAGLCIAVLCILAFSWFLSFRKSK